MVVATATVLLCGGNYICKCATSTKMTGEGCYCFFRFLASLAPGCPLVWREQRAGPLPQVQIGEDQPTLVVTFGRCDLQCAMQAILLALYAAYRSAGHPLRFEAQPRALGADTNQPRDHSIQSAVKQSEI
jgi:hypothetical protein